MNASFKDRMVGCQYAYEIWHKLEVYFASYTKAKVRQLKTQFKAIKKQGATPEYLLKIKTVVDALAAIGSPISNQDHIEVILNRLGEEYAPY